MLKHWENTHNLSKPWWSRIGIVVKIKNITDCFKEMKNLIKLSRKKTSYFSFSLLYLDDLIYMFNFGLCVHWVGNSDFIFFRIHSFKLEKTLKISFQDNEWNHRFLQFRFSRLWTYFLKILYVMMFIQIKRVFSLIRITFQEKCVNLASITFSRDIKTSFFHMFIRCNVENLIFFSH